jgi:hypothetical protein
MRLALGLLASATIMPPCTAVAQTQAAPVVLASDIPVAHTPPGFWKTFPPPILARCTEPLAPGAPDLRGLWAGEHDGKPHIERIEQCGDRVIVESSGVTHDMRADGVLAHGVDDVAVNSGRPIKVAAVFENNGLSLKPFGGPTMVTRVIRGDVLIFTYGKAVIPLHRISALPPGS